MKCCAAGYVNNFVLRKLKQTVTDTEYYSLLGISSSSSFRSYNSNDINADSLPFSWTRNIKNNKSHKKGGRNNCNNSFHSGGTGQSHNSSYSYQRRMKR